MRVGGPARFWCEPTTFGELQEACVYAHTHNAPIVVLGGGSNVVIRDRGINALVMRMRLSGIEIVREDADEVLVRVGAGESWDALVAWTVARGWWGLENLSGIPGTVGAAPIQNINAYGSSVADTIVSVETYHPDQDVHTTFDTPACRFAYRDSVFKQAEGKGWVVTAVLFRLSRVPHAHTAYRSASNAMERYFAEHNITKPSIGDVRDAVLSIRKKIGMLEGCYRSAGSFFKNTLLGSEQFARVKEIVMCDHAALAERLSPWYWELPDGRVKVSTAFLLECTPYNKTAFADRAFRDTVGISPVHSLSLINLSNARASDIEAFMHEMIEAVASQFFITIEPEVLFLGDA